MITNKIKIQKFLSTVFLVSAAVGATMFISTKAISAEISPENRYKNQYVTLPPEIVAFLNAKEQQAAVLAQQQKLVLDSITKSYFDQAKAGHVGVAQILFQDIDERAHDTNVTGQLDGPVWQAAIDALLVVEAVGESDPNFVLATAREMTNSLVPGCIYFGGTDPGRGWPTMLCSAPGEPFFVVSQNPLVDRRYMELLREEYNSRIWLPTTNEVQKCIDDYTADVQARAAKGQLKPGENFQMVDGKPKVEGQMASMGMNALIAKSIFDKNPDREFYVEESFPLDWMYPYLAPHDLLMKLNRQPLAEMPTDEIQNDEDFWSKELAGKIGDWLEKDTPVSNVCTYAEKVFANKDLSDFKGDPKFIANEYSKAYSHWRSSIAGIYAWRLSPQCPPEYRPKNDAQRKQLTDAADFAFRQAFALCPYSPGSAFPYVNYLMQLRRFDDALLVAKTGLACSPKEEQWSGQQFKNLIDQLEKSKPAGVKDLSQLEKEFTSNPTNFTVGLNLAHSYLSLNQTNRALALLDQIVVSKDVNASALGNAAGIFSQLGNLGKLETVLTRMTEVTPESPETWYDLAALKAVFGKKTEAITDLKQALDLNSKRLQTNPSARDLAAQAAKDGRFNSLKGDPEFQNLLPQTAH